jgi:twitching motility protein PilT
MQTLNQALFALYKNKMIALDEAMGRSVEPEEFRVMVDSDARRGGGHPGQDRTQPR